MKENFPSWPCKLHWIGNRCTAAVTLSEKTLKVLLVWGVKDWKRMATNRRDHEENKLRRIMSKE